MAAQAERACGVLAYGDLKRVELAVRSGQRAEALLMDEPTAGMAPRERIALMELTARIARERGIAVLFTEHDMDVVFAHADRIIVLERGRMIADGKRRRRARRTRRVRAVYLGAGVDLREHTDARGRRPPRLLRARPDPGRRRSRPRTARSSRCSAATAPASRPRMKAIMGLVPSARGPHPASQAPTSPRKQPYRIARLGLGYVPEDRRIFTDLTVDGEPRGRPPARPRQRRAAWTPERLFALFPNLAAMRDRPGGQMSGGEQQMLTIARTLMGNPAARAAGRAVGGPGAGDRRADGGGHPRR